MAATDPPRPGWSPDPHYLQLSADRVWVRPRMLTRASRLTSVIVMVVFVGLGATLGATLGSARLSDKLSMVGIGAVLAAVALLFTRPRVEADASGIQVRNILGDVTLSWQVVRAIIVRDGTPWAVLDLHDDEQMSLLAVQTGDGPQAAAALRALRRLHETAIGAPLSSTDDPARHTGRPAGPATDAAIPDDHQPRTDDGPPPGAR